MKTTASVAVFVVALSCATSQFIPHYFYLNPNSVAAYAAAPQPIVQPPAQPQNDQQRSGTQEDEEEAEASQFHSQDGEGRFAFGYSMPDQVRIESRNIDGTVRGSYSYLDPAGKTIKVQYWDDGNGFHSAGNNLPTEIPQPVQDTPEVQAARAHHFRLYKEALEIAAASKTYANRYMDTIHVQDPVQHLQPQHDDNDDNEGVVVESDSHAPVDEKGVELTRYPKLQIPQNLFDPSQVHDEKLEAVIVENPDILGPSFDGNSLRSGKSSENFRMGQTIQQKTTPSLDVSPRKGFSYSFSYPIIPTPIAGQGMYFMGMRGSKDLNKLIDPTFELKIYHHQKIVPVSFTFPSFFSVPFGLSPYQQAVKEDSNGDSDSIHVEPATVETHGPEPVEAPRPTARKGFSYSFSYPVKVKVADHMRVTRSAGAEPTPVGRSGSTYIEVKPVIEYVPSSQTGFAPETDALKSLFARAGTNSPGVSQTAVDHGGIPIAAVHDSQGAPHQQGSVKNHQLAPIFYGNLQNADGSYGGSGGKSDIEISGLIKIPQVSVSEKATYFGAIPVAAVHDQQVAPYQRDSIRNHQILPLYIEHVAY